MGKLTDEERGYLLRCVDYALAKNPHLRLGQLLVNAVITDRPCPELFYIEDGELAQKLIKFGEEKPTNVPGFTA